MTKITGGCQCGAVRYEITAEPMVALHCECLDCKKSSGSGHITAGAFPADAVHITGTLKGYSSPADSGAMTTRSFCPECGGRISFRSNGIPGMVAITAGSMDDPGAITPSIAVYHKRHVGWDHIDPSLPVAETAPQRG
jgi:hypothetical protein